MIVNYLICVVMSMILGVGLVFFIGSKAPGNGLYEVGQTVYGQDNEFTIVSKYIACAKSMSYVPIYILERIDTKEKFIVYEDEIENTAE